MKIDKILEKINYKVTTGGLYNGQELKDKLLYCVYFSNAKEDNKGMLLVSAVNQMVYLIHYNDNGNEFLYNHQHYVVTNEKAKKISLKLILQYITEK